MPSVATISPRSTKQGDDLDSELVIAGKPPAMRPPRVVDYEELDKKAIDILVDSLKYVATSSGIVIAMYAPTLREYVKLPELSARPLAQLLVSRHCFCGLRQSSGRCWAFSRGIT